MMRMPVEIAKSDYSKVVLALAFALVLAASLLWALAGPQPRDAQAQSSNQGETQCVGFLSGPHDNIVVPPGAACILQNAQVKGNVKALENSRLIAPIGSNNTVQGSVYGDKAEIVQFSDSTVRENIEIKEGETNEPGSFDVFFLRTTVQEGNVKIEKMTGDIFVQQSPVQKGNLQLFENLTAFSGLRVTGNRVAQDLQVFKNRGPGVTKVVQFNTVGENLQCFENDPPFVGQPNVAKQAEGQCGATQSPSSASVQSTDTAQDEELEAALEENQRAIDSMIEEAKALEEENASS